MGTSFEMPLTLSREEMERSAEVARQRFRDDRISRERLWSEFYNERFDEANLQVDRVLRNTDNLTNFERDAAELFGDGLLDVLRYMCRPTVSKDDFESVSGAGTSVASRLKDAEAAKKAAEYISRNLNGRVLPWLERGDSPSESELCAARSAVAALIAEQRTKTAMRNSPSRSQEAAVRAALVEQAGFEMVPAHDIVTLADAPKAGQVFSREASVGGVRADIALGLHDGRFMALECKVSNSGVNSYKRLNHEVTDKVEKWYGMFGKNGVVGGCVLQGVYKLENLMSAQEAGVSIFWSHDLVGLLSFIGRTRLELDGA